MHEVAVLVGDYSGLEDDAAIKALKTVKAIVPTSVKFGPIHGADGSTEMIQNWRSAVNQGKKRGPLGMAFLCTNPLLPKEYFQSAGLDKMVVEMNKEVEYSLLKAPGQYSVKIATFRGASILDQNKVRAVEGGRPMVTKLEEAGLSASPDRSAASTRQRGVRVPRPSRKHRMRRAFRQRRHAPHRWENRNQSRRLKHHGVLRSA
ncbi:MAG: hypothetical protein QM811_02440 [Pirellulales bacterium]